MENLPNEMFDEIFKNVWSLNDLKKFRINKHMKDLVDYYIERNSHLIANDILQVNDKSIIGDELFLKAELDYRIRIPSIQKLTINKLQKLEHLTLHHPPIGNYWLIETLEIKNLQNLEILFLDCNITNLIIEKNPKLSHINVDGKISNVIVRNLPNLFGLDIDRCNITKIKFENLNNVRELSMTNNNLDKIDSNIVGLKSLERLNIENNNISEIPNTICLLTNLKILNLEANNISIIPKSLCQLKLKFLNLNNNPILEFDKCLNNINILLINSLNINRRTIREKIYRIFNI
jgi:Leucine-rich repeat (LRR) protein